MHEHYQYTHRHSILTMQHIELTDKILMWSYGVFVVAGPIVGIIVAAISGKY